MNKEYISNVYMNVISNYLIHSSAFYTRLILHSGLRVLLEPSPAVKGRMSTYIIFKNNNI